MSNPLFDGGAGGGQHHPGGGMFCDLEAAAITHKFTSAAIGEVVGCSVHDFMGSYVHTLAHPFFAVTGSAGTFRLPALPPGKYTITVWNQAGDDMEGESGWIP